MATIKFLNRTGHYADVNARTDLVHYITQESKTKSHYVACTDGDPKDFASRMGEVANQFGKDKGVRIRHFILSFYKAELCDPRIASMIAEQIIRHLGNEYQAMYGVHEDTSSLHIHFVHNSVSYLDGHRYYGTRKEYYDLLGVIKGILMPYRIYLTPVSINSGKDIQYE